jgi:hypothetical protein
MMKNANRSIMARNLAIVVLLAGSLLAAGAFSCYLYLGRVIVSDVRKYLAAAHDLERGFIEHVPLYEDFSNPLHEQKLRTYLNPAHIAAAARYGVGPLVTDADIELQISGKKLIRVKARPESLFYFYNVRSAYRALTPGAGRGLDLLTERLQQNFRSRAKLPPVKIAISSMLRPASYQDGLREINANATMMTTHSSGITFDIFYDDYYVVLPQPSASNRISNAILGPVRTRLGFLMGDALRGQIRSVLAETLVQLQDEGVLYAILEKYQRCYHVTILGNDLR